MRKMVCFATLVVGQTAFAGGLKSIAALASAPDVQKLEQEIQVQGGRVFGLLENEYALVPGSTIYRLIYKNRQGQIQEVDGLAFSAGPVGGIR